MNTTATANPAYRIAAILSKMPAEKSTAIRRNLHQRVGVCRQTMHRYISANVGDKIDIPASRLLLIAKELNVPMEALINPKHVK